MSLVGLVHASGVESDAAAGTLRDEHRVLVTAGDRVDNVGQIARLIARGYAGDVSLEPFAPQVQDLDRAAFTRGPATDHRPARTVTGRVVP